VLTKSKEPWKNGVRIGVRVRVGVKTKVRVRLVEG
jgi:hypothetical protein